MRHDDAQELGPQQDAQQDARPEAWPEVPGAPLLRSLADVAGLVEHASPAYVRFSAGPAADRSTVSRDHESGCLLPGLSVNPLTPEAWWDRPLEHWLARQLCQYAHLMTPERYPWVLTGEIAGRGPDCEPLLVRSTPLARVNRAVVDEATVTYRREFDPGEDGA